MSYHKKLNIEASLTRSINQAPCLDFDKLAAIPVVKMIATIASPGNSQYLPQRREGSAPLSRSPSWWPAHWSCWFV